MRFAARSLPERPPHPRTVVHTFRSSVCTRGIWAVCVREFGRTSVQGEISGVKVCELRGRCTTGGMKIQGKTLHGYLSPKDVAEAADTATR